MVCYWTPQSRKLLLGSKSDGILCTSLWKSKPLAETVECLAEGELGGGKQAGLRGIMEVERAVKCLLAFISGHVEMWVKDAPALQFQEGSKNFLKIWNFLISRLLCSS